MEQFKKIFMSEELKSRVKTFLWNIGIIGLTAAVDAVAEQLDIFSLSPTEIVIIGTILTQVSKFLHNYANSKVETL